MARVAGAILLLLLLAGTITVWRVLDVPIATVTVKGKLDAAERVQVEEALQRSLKGGLLSIDLTAITAALNELSWPRHVNVRRVWPDGLVLSLDKALVVAGWGDDYLTIDGEVVQLAAQHDNLVRFDCRHTAPKTALELYQRLQREVSVAELTISRLQENDLGEWVLTFSNGVELNIGASQPGERVQRFVAVYRSDLSSRVAQIATVDARYANGIAVGWRSDSTQPESEQQPNALSQTRLAMNIAVNHSRAEDGVR